MLASIKNHLLALGSSPQEIFETLLSLGINGRRCGYEYGVLTKYLIHQGVKLVPGCWVGCNAARWSETQDMWWFSDNTEFEPLHQFIRNSDTGQYPQLES